LDAVFRLKVDLWLVGLVVGIAVLVLEFLFEGILPDDSGADLLATVVVVIVLGFCLWLYLSTRYTISSDTHGATNGYQLYPLVAPWLRVSSHQIPSVRVNR